MQYRLVYSLACAEDDTEQQRAEQQAQIDAYFDAYAPAQQRLSKAFRAKFEDGVFNGFVLRGVALLPKAGNAARRVVLTDEGAAYLERVRRILAEELTDKQRQAMTAMALTGMPMEELARRMNTNRNALYKLIHDARLKLKRRLAQEGLSPEDLLAIFGNQ